MRETPPEKTLLIVADTHRGGLAFAVKAEAEWFSAQGWRVTIAAPGKIATDGPVTFERLEIPYRTRDVRGIVRAASKARRLTREINASVVHAHGVRSLLVTRLAGTSAYLTLHGLPWAQSRLVASLRRAIVLIAGRLAQESFSVSPELSKNGWHFIPHASPRLASLSQVDFVTPYHPIFLWLGALATGKRPEMFVRAVTKAARVTPMRGVIVGSGPLTTSVEGLVQQLDAPIDVMPFTDDVAPLYERSTAVVLTSASEGVPFVLEEAMWCGRAVIATDLPGTRWLMGKTGRLVQSEAELVEALIALSEADTAILRGRECEQQVRRRLAPDSPWPEIERIFLCGGSADTVSLTAVPPSIFGGSPT